MIIIKGGGQFIVRTNEYPYLITIIIFKGKLEGYGNWMVGNREIGLVSLCFAGENVNSAHSSVKIKTVLLKINIFFKIF